MITEEISSHLKDPEAREQAFEHFYKEVFPAVAGLVSKQGGTFQDAKDIFQDALVIFYEKSMNDKLDIRLSEEAYLTGIAKHLWIRKFKSNIRLTSLDSAEQEITLPEDYVNAQNENRLLQLLEVAGKKCLDLLHAIYYNKQSMDEISTSYGFSSAHSASAQKYKCLEKVKATVKQKSLRYEDFLE